MFIKQLILPLSVFTLSTEIHLNQFCQWNLTSGHGLCRKCPSEFALKTNIRTVHEQKNLKLLTINIFLVSRRKHFHSILFLNLNSVTYSFFTLVQVNLMFPFPLFSSSNKLFKKYIDIWTFRYISFASFFDHSRIIKSFHAFWNQTVNIWE